MLVLSSVIGYSGVLLHPSLSLGGQLFKEILRSDVIVMHLPFKRDMALVILWIPGPQVLYFNPKLLRPDVVKAHRKNRDDAVRDGVFELMNDLRRIAERYVLS